MQHYNINTDYDSPNYSSRGNRAITMLCAHATVGSFKSSLGWLCNPASEVSSHYLISKSGDIYQLVPDGFAAWHAGISFWKGLGSFDIRQGSLSVELENLTGMGLKDGTVHPQDPYPRTQLDAFVWLSRYLIDRYAIKPDMVVRHRDIAPGRKSDPQGFPWGWYRVQLFGGASRYRVKAAVTAGALVRSQAKRGASVLDKLPAGAVVLGSEIPGDPVDLAGIGKSDLWIQRVGGGYISKVLLEAV